MECQQGRGRGRGGCLKPAVDKPNGMRHFSTVFQCLKDICWHRMVWGSKRFCKLPAQTPWELSSVQLCTVDYFYVIFPDALRKLSECTAEYASNSVQMYLSCQNVNRTGWSNTGEPLNHQDFRHHTLDCFTLFQRIEPLFSYFSFSYQMYLCGQTFSRSIERGMFGAEDFNLKPYSL